MRIISFLLNIDSIKINRRMRRTDEGKVQDLCESIKNLGLLSLAFPETFAVNESAILKMGHDFRFDEIVHHVIGDCPVVWDVSPHC